MTDCVFSVLKTRSKSSDNTLSNIFVLLLSHHIISCVVKREFQLQHKNEWQAGSQQQGRLVAAQKYSFSSILFWISPMLTTTTVAASTEPDFCWWCWCGREWVSSLGSKEHGWAAWVCNLEISQSLQWLESSRSLTVAAPLRKALARTQLLRVECCCLLLFSTGCLQTPSAQQFLWDGRVGWWGQQYYLANTGNNNTPLLAATAELIIIMLVIFHC